MLYYIINLHIGVILAEKWTFYIMFQHSLKCETAQKYLHRVWVLLTNYIVLKFKDSIMNKIEALISFQLHKVKVSQRYGREVYLTLVQVIVVHIAVVRLVRDTGGLAKPQAGQGPPSAGRVQLHHDLRVERVHARFHQLIVEAVQPVRVVQLLALYQQVISKYITYI